MRRIDLTRPHFRASLLRHAPEGSAEHGAVMRVIADLFDERLSLPGADDREVNIPPRMPCIGRSIPGTGLLVCYVVRGDVVYVHAVMRG